MVKAAPVWLGAIIGLSACSTANDFHQPIEIVGGLAQVVAAEARDYTGGHVLADLSTAYTGTLEASSDREVHGVIKVRGVTYSVFGDVKDQEDGLVFDVNAPPPYFFRVRTDPGDLFHYTLVSINTLNGDVTGDSIPEQYRLFLYLDKTPP